MHPLAGWPARFLGSPRKIAAALFVASLALRAVLAWEMADTPLFRHHEWKETDNRFFVEWADQIANGDWLGRTPLHPYHVWHEYVARHWARGQHVPFSEAVGKQLWNDWYGGLRFHQEPLYAYLLALTRWLTGDVRWIFVLQAIAGALTTALVFSIGVRLGGTAAGLVAAGAHLAYGPMVYYDLMLHRTSLQTFGSVLTVFLLMRAHSSARRRDYALLGAVLGLTTLLMSTAGPMLVIVAGVTLTANWRTGLRQVLVMCAAAALAASPAIARNVVLHVPPLQMSSVGAVTFINGTASDVDPGAGFTQSQHAIDIMTETHGEFWAAAVAAVVTHSGVSWTALMAQKLAYFFTPIEIPNNDSYAYYASYSRLLGGPLLGFTLFGSLFVMGLGAGLMRRRVAWPAMLQVGLGLALILLFYNLSRFRAPVVAAAFPLMGLAVVELFTALRARRVASVLVTLALAATPWMGLALVAPVSAAPIRAVDVTEGNLRWQSLIRSARTPQRALAIAEWSLRGAPNGDEMLGPASPWSRAERARVARSVAALERQAAALAPTASPAAAQHGQRAIALEQMALTLDGTPRRP